MNNEPVNRPVSDRELETIKELLVQSGVNTTLYKDAFVKRRINIAFRRSGAKSREEYLARLKQNPEELKKLAHTFSINVTRFVQNQVNRPVSDRELDTIKELLVQSGVNTTLYKDAFLKRRINIAFRCSHAKSHEEYLVMLKQNPEELKKLAQTLSVKVPRFSQNQVNRPVSGHALETIKELLVQSGVNLSPYKGTFLKRRINLAFRRSLTKSHEEYLVRLKQDPEELEKLAQMFSINVTWFFRNQDTFEQLDTHYLPQLVVEKGERTNPSIKVWSVGCANGAEPYTLAILFARLLGEHRVKTLVRIIGTDYNPHLLKVAEEGFYPEISMEEIPPPILETYFTKLSPNLYQISPQIQQMVQFRLHDLLKDPPLKQQDVVVCRNVLIYFSRQSQKRLYAELAKSVNPHGLLILGRTENLPGDYRGQFKILDSKHRIYQKI